MLQPTAPIEEIEEWLEIENTDWLTRLTGSTAYGRHIFQFLCDTCQKDIEFCDGMVCQYGHWSEFTEQQF